MAKENTRRQENEKIRIHFNLLGLVVFSVSLIFASGLLAFALAHPFAKLGGRFFADESAKKNLETEGDTKEAPAWGEFSVYDIQLERPEEYVAFELEKNKDPLWTFTGKPDDVRKLMQGCGLTGQQIEKALSPKRVTVTDTSTIVRPEDELIFSLSPDVRTKLYGILAKDPTNCYMHFPFCMPGDSLNEVLSDSDVDSEITSLVRSLVYRRGDAQYFSDLEAVLHRIPNEEQQIRLLKALSRQSAVMVRVRIRPTTDVDKLLGYWGKTPGFRLMNVRPLLESLKRLQDGGSVGLGFLLPEFARERLYTYPLPPQPGDSAMDCHWSTLNFFNENPDNRFSNPAFSSAFVTTNFYQVAKPTQYGDVIFLLDEKGNAIHSAVYLADDIVFTKNGNNYMEPWMLMRLKSLVANYSVVNTPRIVVYRNRNRNS